MPRNARRGFLVQISLTAFRGGYKLWVPAQTGKG